jgi:hypothetical protein
MPSQGTCIYLPMCMMLMIYYYVNWKLAHYNPQTRKDNICRNRDHIFRRNIAVLCNKIILRFVHGMHGKEPHNKNMRRVIEQLFGGKWLSLHLEDRTGNSGQFISSYK